MAKSYRKKSTEKQVEKAVTKTIKKHKTTALVAVLCFFVAFIIAFSVGFVLTKNDGFTIVGNANITLSVGEDFIDNGAILTAYGKEYNDLIKVTIYDEDGNELDEVNTLLEGKYFVVYSLDKIPENAGLLTKIALKKYQKYNKVRTVSVGEDNA